MLAFVIGSVAGVLVGFWFARQPRVAAVFDPYVKMINALPRVVLAPIFALWFGLGIWSKVALGVTLVFFIVFFNVYQGVKEVSPTVLANARMLGMSERQLMRHVYWPSALSWMFSSLHTSVGFAVVGAVVGEYLGSAAGLGYLIQQAEGVFDVAGVFAGMFVLAAFVIAIDWLVTLVEKRLLVWRPVAAEGRAVSRHSGAREARPIMHRAWIAGTVASSLTCHGQSRFSSPRAALSCRQHGGTDADNCLAGWPALLALMYRACRSAKEGHHRDRRRRRACAICRPCWPSSSANTKRPAFNVELVDFKGGSQALNAVIGGSADVVSGYFDHCVNLAAKNQELKPSWSMTAIPAWCWWCRQSRPRKIKSVKDLKGKKVGVSAPGSSTDFFLKYLLRKNGVDPTGRRDRRRPRRHRGRGDGAGLGRRRRDARSRR